MLFHEAMARSLAHHDVSVVFGVLGDGNLFMTDSFVRQARGRYVSTSHEAGAVLAANGYARTAGRLGVATVTHGPALTNTVTALHESVKDRTPMLVVAGDTAAADRDNLQNISQREVVLASGAGFEQLRAPGTYAEDLAVAIRRAHVERRPVVLNVPVDFQWEEVEYHPPTARFVASQGSRPDLAVLDHAVGIVASARRPVVVAGQGASTSGAREALLRLAERLGAPVATTLRGIDLFRGVPHNLGVFGTLSGPASADTINHADCVIVFGAGLNKWTTAEGSFLAGKRVVHVDIELGAINRWTTVDVGVVGDAAATADAIVEMLDDAGCAPTAFASPGLADRLAAEDKAARVISPDLAGALDLPAAVKRIDAEFPRDRAVVVDGGRWATTCLSAFRVPDPRSYVFTVNFGSIGLGMGNALGACCSAPDRPVLLLSGDGGFMLGGLNEFSTAVRHGMDLVVVLFNDGAYGAEHIQFRRRNLDPGLAEFSWPDFASVASALGGEGHSVRTLTDLDTALSAVAHRRKPMLIDIKLDPETVPARDH